VEHRFVKKALQVRLWGMDAELRAFTETVRTTQIAAGAVELESPKRLSDGEVVGLGYKEKKARFRVYSVQLASANIYRILLETTGTECLWAAELASPDPNEPERQERRRHARYPVTGSAVIFHLDGETSTAARLVDISDSGFYIETFSPSAPGTALRVRLTVAQWSVGTEAVVRTTHPSIGMGLEIIGFNPETDRQAFQDLLAHVRGTTP
jgi:hypothetical protein